MHRVRSLSFSGLDIRSSFCSLIYSLSRYIYMRTNSSYNVRNYTMYANEIELVPMKTISEKFSGSLEFLIIER